MKDVLDLGEHAERLRPSDWDVVKFIISLIRPKLGTFLLAFVLILVSRLASLVLPASTRMIVDELAVMHRWDLIGKVVFIVSAAAAVQGLASLGTAELLTKGSQRLIAALRSRVQQHLLLLPMSFHDRNRIGALTSRVLSDIDGMRNLIGSGFVEFLGSIVTALCAFVLLVKINLWTTQIVAVVIILFIACLIVRFRVTRPLFYEQSRTYAELSARLTESIGGVRVIKGFSAEAKESTQFADRVSRFLTIVCRTITADATMALGATSLMSVAAILVIYVGIRLVIQGRLTIGSYLTYTVLLGYITWPLVTAITIGSQFTDTIVGLGRTLELLSEPAEQSPSSLSVRMQSCIRGEIEFRNVSFSYRPGCPILNDISFTAEANRSVALVGSNGSGKSTIASLICGFYMPTGGIISVDGVNLATINLRYYREQIGLVSQDTFLFDGTVRENILFGRSDITEERFQEVCRTTHVSEFVEKLSGGYETVVGERGVRLSGGQRQRIAIARALAANPRILILDEATSNVDYESERLIQEALSALLKSRTTIVIAHRLSTVMMADEILVIEGGRIVETGTHASLYVHGNRYRSLYERQINLLM